jgi:hypothetical protein
LATVALPKPATEADEDLFRLGPVNPRLILPIVAALSAACSSSSSNGNLFVTQTTADCGQVGTWAIFVEVGVEWQSTVISPGAGTVKQWILSRNSIGPDGRLQSTAHACGIGAQNVPLGSPWFSTIEVPQLQMPHEWTGVQFSADLFDKGTLEETPIPVAITSPDPQNPAIGDEFTTQPAPFTFGLQGLDPNAPWPTRDEIPPYLFDSDQDGNPGVTGLPFSGHVPGEPDGINFSDPRLTITVNPPPRASLLFLALRTRAGLQGRLSACAPEPNQHDTLGPRLDGIVIPNTLLVELRNVSCTVTGANALCLPDQVKFIDDNLPQFKPNGTSRFVGLKVPDDTTCLKVRSLKY